MDKSIEQFNYANYGDKLNRDETEIILRYYKPSEGEIDEVLNSLDKDKIENRRRKLRENNLLFSNIDVALSFINGTEIQEKLLTNQAFQILVRKEIKRERPIDEEDIKKTIAYCINTGQTLEIATVWGGFKNNEKGEADKVDEEAMGLIQETVKQLRKIGINVKIILYFADLHAISPYFGRSNKLFNNSRNYRKGIERIANAYNFNVLSISKSLYGFSNEILKKAIELPENISLSYIIDPKKIEEFYKLGHDYWEKADDKTKKETLQAVEKYSLKGLRETEGDEKLAILYLGSRIFEKSWFDGTNKKRIFFAYGHPNYDIQPRKTIFWHSLERGINQPPWFIDSMKYNNRGRT